MANASNGADVASNCSSGVGHELQKLQCPVGYIPVPANPLLGVNEEFCVAKFEMRCTGSGCSSYTPGVNAVAISHGGGNAWAHIMATDAWNACINLNTENPLTDKLADNSGDGTYALISNSEWMTIARSIEDEEDNWKDGILNRGWSAKFIYEWANELFSYLAKL